MEQRMFSESMSLLERALKVIPNGTQTFSKSRTQYPVGAAPLYAYCANGSHLWDADGNEYVDFVAGLGAIILGYRNEEVDQRVWDQMHQGAIFSLPHPIEIEVAETLCEIIPSAEMVRFGKNGSDATSGAVRLARHITGRDHVLTCEGHYHGWQDWSNGITGRNGGVPGCVRGLTHTFRYNDIESLHRAFRQYPFQVACVIMEPMVAEWPRSGFLQEVHDVCRKNGAVFILDEMLTGFRFSLGGAQKVFGVVPDLSCFGKAMGNGYPISAIVGRGDLMRRMEEIHFSFTFGGDCISLAAAKATIGVLRGIGVPAPAIDKLPSTPFLKGYPSRPKIDFSGYPPGCREKVLQECYANGVLVLDHVNFMACHSEEDLKRLVSTIEGAFKRLPEIELKGTRSESQFQVRSKA